MMMSNGSIKGRSDPVIFELMQNALAAVAEQMAVTVVRTARSSVSREVMDFSTAICSERGEFVAQGHCLPIMLGSVPAAMQAVLARYSNDLSPGDIFVMNDPYEGGSHLPDIFMFKPIFAESSLIGFSCVVTHHADIGGIAPGGISSLATEIYQEGLRIPLAKLFEGGKRNDTVFEFIARNVRVPEKVIGDLNSQISACALGEQGLIKIADEFGLETVRRYLDDLLDYSEERTRAALRQLPDGVFAFEDSLDDDGKSPDPIPIRVVVRKAGDSLTADFTGTGSQVKGAINMTRSDTLSCLYFVARCLLDPDIPNNAGCFRPLGIKTVRGTIVDAASPAAVASRVLTSFRVVDVLFGALAEIFPHAVPACGMAADCNVCISGQLANGKPYVQLDWLAGSWGGRPDRDGIDHVSPPASNISNTPVELVETESPLVIDEYVLLPDSEGAGLYRGGLAIGRTWRLVGADEATLLVRADRHKTAPYGLNGGLSGKKARNVLRVNDSEKEMPSKFQAALKRGDSIRIETAGAGGWGHPWRRDAEKVAHDVRYGRISSARAKEAYGVVVEPRSKTLDAGATETLRRSAQLSPARERREGPR
jgi:N-methylhydantoinase B